MAAMLTRAIPLVIVMVAACRSTPVPESFTMVGTWEWRIVIPEQFRHVYQRPTIDRVATENLWATETFAPNGQWSTVYERPSPDCRWPQFTIRKDGVVVPTLHEPVEAKSHWRVSRVGRSSIDVEIEHHAKLGGPAQRTFEIVDENHLTFRERDLDYTMVRVKDAK